jgi:hypothetical protein
LSTSCLSMMILACFTAYFSHEIFRATL